MGPSPNTAAGGIIDAIERVLRRDPSVADCAVLVRGGQILAYVTYESVRRDAAIADALRAAGLPAAVIVPVTRIPRTANGAVDEPALTALPVLDAAVAAAWQELVTSLPGVREGVAVVTPAAPSSRALHVAELWPEWRRGGGMSSDTAPAAVHPVAGDVESAATQSEVHGRVLPPDAQAPRTLPAALFRAAATPRGITYVLEDGGERVQSYAALLEEASRVLTGLREAGGAPGDVIIFQLGAAVDFLPVFWACMLGGFVPVPVAVAPSYTQPNATVAKLRHAWTLLGARFVVTTADLTAAV
ncbi:MAG TPA: hypothetical protein VNR64_01890, partial [Vicinamibacterales bacterium]|nr:hypothetical protein [Vicinamibacterales bacterium]